MLNRLRLLSLTVCCALIGCVSFGRIQAQSQPFITHTDIPYATLPNVDQAATSLDLYLPQGDGPFPLIIFVHGGAWAIGDKAHVNEKPAFFTSNGYAFASVNYRLSPWPPEPDNPDRIAHPTHVQDVARAITFLANTTDYPIDANHIALLGHSAGGHLVTLAASDPIYLQQAGGSSADIDCVIGLDAGGYDIPFILANSSDGLTVSLYHSAFSAEPPIQQAASPINHIQTSPMPRFLLVHQGSGKRRAISERYHAALLDQNQTATLYNADPLNHAEINRLLGTPEQTAYNAAVLNFANACRGVPTATHILSTAAATPTNPPHILLTASLLLATALRCVPLLNKTIRP